MSNQVHWAGSSADQFRSYGFSTLLAKSVRFMPGLGKPDNMNISQDLSNADNRSEISNYLMAYFTIGRKRLVRSIFPTPRI